MREKKIMKQEKRSTAEYVAYKDLAWTDSIICNPEEYVQETEIFCKAIKENSKIAAVTMLHLGCGAGIYDYTLKKHFKVTGVDISKEMLTLAKKVNPEIQYIHGDMRAINLKETFDAVAIPDSIGYMTIIQDLQKAIFAADKHLKPGGVLVIVASIAEKFRPNNFVYTGTKGDIEITIFENNYLPAPDSSTYEAVLVYLVRNKGKLEIHTDRHIIGIFKRTVWLDLLKRHGFEVKETSINHLYDRFILENGKYPLSMFICTKKL
jgi:SAM-dependent methyltransferase